MSTLTHPVHCSKDIAEVIDSAKREIIDLYRHHRFLTSIDVSVFMNVNGIPTIKVEYKGFMDDG